MDYAVACDPAGGTQKYMQAFGLQGIPSAIVIDKKGKMVWAGHPMDGGFEAALAKVDSQTVAPKVNGEEGEEEEEEDNEVLKQVVVASVIVIALGVAAYFYLSKADE